MKKIKHKLLKNDVLLLNNSFDQRSEEVLADSASTPFEVTIENEEIFANVAGSNEQQSSIEHDFIFSNEDNLFNINLQQLEEDDQVNYISTSLLALFFAGNLTQTSLKLITEYVQMFTQIKIPKSFNQLLNYTNIKPFAYTKQFYCQNCLKYVVLSRPQQRQCSQCSNGYIGFANPITAEKF